MILQPGTGHSFVVVLLLGTRAISHGVSESLSAVVAIATTTKITASRVLRVRRVLWVVEDCFHCDGKLRAEFII